MMIKVIMENLAAKHFTDGFQFIIFQKLTKKKLFPPLKKKTFLLYNKRKQKKSIFLREMLEILFTKNRNILFEIVHSIFKKFKILCF